MLKATWQSYTAPALALRNGAEVEIRSQLLAENQPPVPGGGDLICAGAVDDYEVDIVKGGNKSVTLHGRSHARDVIDCPPVDHPTGQVQNATLLEAAQQLGKEFAVAWSSDQPLTKIAHVVWHAGETLFRTIEREANAEGVTLTGQRDGSIKLTRAGTQRHSGALVEGQPPVSRWSVKVSLKTNRSVVAVRGQRPGSADPADLRQEVRVTPGNPPARHRPTLVYLDGDRVNKKLTTRGQWHHLRGFGFGTVVGPRVSSWRDGAGTLWDPGRLMAISVPSEQIDMDMVLSEVTLRQSRGQNNGTRAELVFVDPRSLGGSAPMGGSEPADQNPGETLD
jgi:prophage tail gpP-like protein